MLRILFLYKSKTSFYCILIFLINKINNILIKKKIINFKKKHQDLIKEKKITNDYFSSHAYNFNFFLKDLNSNFNYLEIGSYEGNSAIFVANNFKNSKIDCIDNWNKTEDYQDHKDFKHIENNFDHNVKNYKNIKKFKCSSDEFFLKNEKKYDVIYVDGYHHASQVYKDCKNAWNSLKFGGYLICDDYIWNFYKDIKENPCYAVNRFLQEISDDLIVKKISNSQIFVKKTRSKD